MSKQSEAKAAQNYVAKPVPMTCATCRSLSKDPFYYDEAGGQCQGVNPKESSGETTYFSNLRCDIGGFAVKMRGTCDFYSPAA